MICTINNNTITVESDTQLSLESMSIDWTMELYSILIDINKVFISYPHKNKYLYGVVYNIVDNKVSVGLNKKLVYAGDEFSNPFILLLNDNEIFIVYREADTKYLYGLICKIKETVITSGQKVKLTNTPSAGHKSVISIQNEILVLYDSETNCFLNASVIDDFLDLRIEKINSKQDEIGRHSKNIRQ